MMWMIKTDHLEHSAKGTTWKKHKYLKVLNGRYIYPKELEKESNSKKQARQIGATGSNAIANQIFEREEKKFLANNAEKANENRNIELRKQSIKSVQAKIEKGKTKLARKALSKAIFSVGKSKISSVKKSTFQKGKNYLMKMLLIGKR